MNTEPTTEVTENTSEGVEDIDNMSESELDALFDKPSDDVKEDEQTTATKEEPVVNLDDLYTAQMTDTDSKLDKPILLKVNGQVIEVDNINDLKNMAEMGTGAQQKFKAIAEHKDTLQFMEANGITKETLEAMITDGGQQPVQVDTNANDVESIATQILQSPFADDFKTSMATMPDYVKNEISDNPRVLNGLGVDFSTGLAQTIMPHVAKEMATKGLDFVSAYKSVGTRLQSNRQTADAQKEILKASPTVNSSSAGVSKDVWDMDQAEFDKYFEAM